MNTKDTLRTFEKVAGYYITELDNYSSEKFRSKPSEEEWSLSQLYNHLITAAFHMQMKAIEDCELGRCSVLDGEKTEVGAAVFAAGAFPPIQIKVPAKPGYTPDYSTDKQEIKERMLQVIEEMRSVEQRLASIPPDRKIEHPAFGCLNAVEWFQLVPMHFAHHLRQKEKLEAL